MFFWDAVFWIKVIRDVAIGSFAKGVGLIETKEVRKVFWILVLNGEVEAVTDFFLGADTFKWLDSFWEDETIKGFEEAFVVEKIVAEDALELGFFDERIKHDIDIEALGTVAAPFILFSTNVAAAKKREILWEL